jgi:hypothetical protein
MDLYTSTKIEALPKDLFYFIPISEGINNFLAKPHLDFGRSGEVSDYIASALKSETIQLAVIRFLKILSDEPDS